MARLVDRLTVKLGASRVRRPSARGEPFARAGERVGERRSRSSRRRARSAEGAGSCRLHRPGPSPAGEAKAPAPARPARGDRGDLCHARGLPRRFVWRRRGARHRPGRRGPSGSRPNGGASRRRARLRDYYQVEDAAGRRYWIYREGVIGDGRGGAARLVHPRAVRVMRRCPNIPASRARNCCSATARRRRVIARAPIMSSWASPRPFSFLRGASDAIELALTALELGMDSLGVADRNTLAGVVRMHSACKGAGLKPLIGCRLDLAPRSLGTGGEGRSVDALEPSRASASSLTRSTATAMAGCRPCSAGARCGRDKGECHITLDEVAEHAEGIAFILWPDDDLDAFADDLRAREGRDPVAAPPRRLPSAIAATTSRGSSGSTASRGRRAARSSPPTTSIITRPTSARCRT